MHRRLITAAAAALPLLAGPAAGGSDTLWYRITAATGEPVGYATEAVTETDRGRTVTSAQHVDVYAPSIAATEDPLFGSGGQAHIETQIVRSEDPSGRTIAITVTRRARDNSLLVESRIDGDTAMVTRSDSTGTTVHQVALPPGTRFDGGDGLLRGWNPARDLAFNDFDAGAGAVDRVTVTALPGPPGTVLALRRREHDGAIVSLDLLTIAADGRIVDSRQPMFGTDIDVALATREAALAPHDPYRLIPASATKSPYRIPDSALHGHIRYRFGFRDGIVFAPPQTGEQRVTADGPTATIDICADCGPGLAGDPATLAGALKPTPWLQSDAVEIRTIANRFAAYDDARKMEKLTKVTALRLPGIDFVGHYSALAALQRRSGDCTESAVLLAALGRAAGIPTKVANGIVYSREYYHGVTNVFLPHSWVLAYVGGRWKSYDAALGDFDATHIALSINDGDDRSAFAAQQLAGLLTFEAVEEVRARPAP